MHSPTCLDEFSSIDLPCKVSDACASKAGAICAPQLSCGSGTVPSKLWQNLQLQIPINKSSHCTLDCENKTNHKITSMISVTSATTIAVTTTPTCQVSHGTTIMQAVMSYTHVTGHELLPRLCRALWHDRQCYRHCPSEIPLCNIPINEM